MAKNKRKYFINRKIANKVFNAYGFSFREMNWYQYRVYHEEFKGFFDWFHTQGTVCVCKDGQFGKLAVCAGPESLAKRINKYVYAS